jgi:hypothetical protein
MIRNVKLYIRTGYLKDVLMSRRKLKDALIILCKDMIIDNEIVFSYSQYKI